MIKGLPINILLDTGSASSHVTRALIRKIGSEEKTRSRPLQIIGFGNQKADLIYNYATLHLKGKYGEMTTIDFNIFESDLITDIPGVSSQILDEFPHLMDHRHQLTAPIPRGPQKVDAIIGTRDIVNIYVVNPMRSKNQCPDVCFLTSVDGSDSAIEARRTLFGIKF